jgi:hypothetical protein
MGNEQLSKPDISMRLGYQVLIFSNGNLESIWRSGMTKAGLVTLTVD